MAYYNSVQEHPQMQIQYPFPIVYYTSPTITYNTFVPYYDRKTSTGLGATQIILACLSIAAGVIAIAYDAGYHYVGIGIWGGAFFLIAGALSIAAGKEPTNSLITAILVFSVLDIIIGAALFSIASYGLSDDLNCQHVHHPSYCTFSLEAVVAANSLMIAAGSLEFIFAIWMMVISARAIDRGTKSQMNRYSLIKFVPFL